MKLQKLKLPRTKLMKLFNWLGPSGTRGDLRGQSVVFGTFSMQYTCKATRYGLQQEIFLIQTFYSQETSPQLAFTHTDFHLKQSFDQKLFNQTSKTLSKQHVTQFWHSNKPKHRRKNHANTGEFNAKWFGNPTLCIVQQCLDMFQTFLEPKHTNINTTFQYIPSTSN